MSMPDQPAVASERWKLGEQLEQESKRLAGVKQDHWIDQASLCGSCKFSKILRQTSKNNRVIRCDHFGGWMPDDITECNAYQKIGSLSLAQMVEIATLIDDRPDRYKGYL
jgi:aerobic-type carbon monoxide dehydrogenase small subunit (CoxS/CutS family)